MEAMAKKSLPGGMTYEWSGLSLEEIQSGGKAMILFGLTGVRLLDAGRSV
jgi:HAE1 family hydrophobic/amphiphilic exporter-1